MARSHVSYMMLSRKSKSCPARKNRGKRTDRVRWGLREKGGSGMSVAASPSDGLKIDIGASVRAAYSVVIENARLAVDLAWLPFAILVAAELVAWLLGRDRLLVQLVAPLIDAAGFAVFALPWHRFILLGE